MPEQSYRTWLAGSTAVGLADDYFGFSVAIDDDRAVVGAHGRDRNPLLIDDNSVMEQSH